jgi:hypothetical protein
MGIDCCSMHLMAFGVVPSDVDSDSSTYHHTYLLISWPFTSEDSNVPR